MWCDFLQVETLAQLRSTLHLPAREASLVEVRKVQKAVIKMQRVERVTAKKVKSRFRLKCSPRTVIRRVFEPINFRWMMRVKKPAVRALQEGLAVQALMTGVRACVCLLGHACS